MTTYENQVIWSFDDRDSAALISDIKCTRCRFEDCSVGITTKQPLRTRIRNLELVDCRYTNGFVGPIIAENVRIHNFGLPGRLHTYGAVFRHVTFTGRIGTLLITPTYDEMSKAIDAANVEYYQAIDWAIDISKARFTSGCDIRNIPARLFRRDPETQFVVRRERVLDGRWRELDLSDTYWNVSLQWLADGDMEDRVLVAPRGNRHFKQLLAGLQLLREAGIAEPD